MQLRIWQNEYLCFHFVGRELFHIKEIFENNVWSVSLSFKYLVQLDYLQNYITNQHSLKFENNEQCIVAHEYVKSSSDMCCWLYFFQNWIVSPNRKALKLCLFIKDELILVHPSISITIISIYNLLCFRLADCDIEARLQLDQLVRREIPVPVVHLLKERL